VIVVDSSALKAPLLFKGGDFTVTDVTPAAGPVGG
jgi:uncharacterized protein with PIN domain